VLKSFSASGVNSFIASSWHSVSPMSMRSPTATYSGSVGVGGI
jgi:hypothetical protein